MLYTILTSNNPKFFYYKLLLFITIIAVIYYIYRASEPPKKSKENFTQDAPFLLKTNLDVYDQFYAEVYDGITEREKSCQRELYQIIKMTNPDTKNSVFLDIGSGTGCVVNELTQAGYTAYGVDQSEAMVDISEAKYPEIEIFQRNVTDAMCFDKGLFTHILCTNFTIYELKDKNIFFRNCYHWLKPNGYLVVHLVDREKFSAKKFEDSIMDLSALYRTIWPSTTNNKSLEPRNTNSGRPSISALAPTVKPATLPAKELMGFASLALIKSLPLTSCTEYPIFLVYLKIKHILK